MKKKFLLLMGAFSIGLLNAQVGINTTDPRGIFHIDASGNNGDPLLTQAQKDADDAVVDIYGNLGLGVVSPDAKLDVNGQIVYNDGTQAVNYMLASDASGVVSWKKPPDTQKLVRGTFNISTSLNSTASKYTGHYITLTEGIWMITFIGTYVNGPTGSNMVFWRLSTSNTALTPPEGDPTRYTSYSSYGAWQFHMPITTYFLVKPAVTTTYYMWASLRVATSVTYTGEGNIFAMPLM